MPRSCTICTAPNVARIDALLATGRSVNGVARELGLPYGAMKRHAHQHTASRLTSSPVAIGAARFGLAGTARPGEDDADPLVALLAELRQRASSSPNPAWSAVYRAALADHGKWTREHPPETNLYADPELQAVIAVVWRALLGYPEIRARIVTGLTALKAEALLPAGLDDEISVGSTP